jgi:transposase
MIMAWHRSSEASRRLDDIPGVGPALATALVASIYPAPQTRPLFHRTRKAFVTVGVHFSHLKEDLTSPRIKKVAK